MARNPSITALSLLKERGFKVFPLRQNDKRPAFDGWQAWAVAATENKINAYGTANPTNNWGVHTGPSGLIILDVDNKKGKNGSQTIANILRQKEIQDVPKTFTVRTPTGGLHYYFKGSARPIVGLAEGLDIRAGESYVVAPGSIIDDRVYEVLDASEAANAPAWLLELIDAHKSEKVVLSDTTPVLEGHRNQTLASIAGTMRSRGLGYDAIIAALTVVNETQLHVPLPTEEVETIARSISRYAPEISMTAADFIESPLQVESIGYRKLSSFQGTPPRREWLIEDWIPMGEISSLYGSGGSGKSLIALQLALAVGTKGKWLGMEVKTPMPVMSIFCEDTEEEVHRRLHDIKNSPEYDFLAADNTKDPEIYLWPRVGMNNDLARENDKKNDLVVGMFRKELEAGLAAMPTGPKLLILDTLSDVYLGDENIRNMVNKFVKTHIGSLVKKYECTVLILAHPSRAGQNTGDQLSGSTAWENAVRNRLAFLPLKVNPEIMVLKRMKSNYAKRGAEVLLKWDKGRFITLTNDEIYKQQAAAENSVIVEAIAIVMAECECGRPRSLKELAEAIERCADAQHLTAGIKYRALMPRIKAALYKRVEFAGFWYELQESPYKGQTSYNIIKTRAETVENVVSDDACYLQ